MKYNLVVRPTMRARLTAGIGVAILWVASSFAQSTLPHLRGVSEVREWFNAGKGHVRLILLLSPT